MTEQLDRDELFELMKAMKPTDFLRLFPGSSLYNGYSLSETFEMCAEAAEETAEAHRQQLKDTSVRAPSVTVKEVHRRKGEGRSEGSG